MKLVYGTYQYYPILKQREEDAVAISMGGLKEGLYDLQLLPPDTLGAANDVDFDQRYADFLLSCKLSSIMRLIEILRFHTVYLVIADDIWTDIVVESFLKFIQVRYGITGTHIESREDLNYAGETEIDPYYGIVNYDRDYEAYQVIEAQIRIGNGENPYAIAE